MKRKRKAKEKEKKKPQMKFPMKQNLVKGS